MFKPATKHIRKSIWIFSTYETQIFRKYTSIEGLVVGRVKDKRTEDTRVFFRQALTLLPHKPTKLSIRYMYFYTSVQYNT